MRRFVCVILIAAGVFAIYVLLLAINNFCGSMMVIALAIIFGCFMTRDPFSAPDPDDNILKPEENIYREA